MTDLTGLTALAALAALRAGTLSAAAYVDALLARATEWQHLNAFASLEPERARAAAVESDARRRRGEVPGALEGLPIVIKDNVDVAGWVTTAGTPALARHRPARTATVARRLLEAGAILIGKNTMHELAHGITCNNAAFGAVRNPYDPTRIPGGSSGGTAAAIAARLAPVGLGTDTGGSVRIPAALCGIVGFRPTTGRYPGEGLVPISHTRDTAGPLARSVADLALLDGILAADPAPLPALRLAGLRIGVPRALFYAGLDPELAALTEAALGQLTDAGAVLLEADVPGLDALSARVAGTISDYEFPRDLAAYLAASGSGLTLGDVIAALASPDLIETFAHEVQGPNAPGEAAYRDAIEVGRPAVQRAFRGYFAAHGVEAIVFPTTPLPACAIGADATVELGGVKLSTFTTYVRNARPASTAGLPALSLPIGRTAAGLPVGLEFAGPTGQDRRVLALAAAIEPLFEPLPAPGR